jgi:Flp pilus assembly protein TadG
MMPLFVVTLPVLILLCGLSIDLGRLELQEQRMQTAADAAAISAELEAERGTGNWISIGQQDAAQNGFTNGAGSTTVTVVQFANYGAYNGRYDGLQVTITQQVKTLFMGALNGGYVTAKAQSVAQITPCVYLLGTTQQPYTLDGATGDFKSESCPFNINNNIYTQVMSLVPEALNVAGSAGSSSINGYEFPTPNYNYATVTDPLSYIASPSFGGSCNHTGYSLYNISTNTTLSPGTYCGGLSITNSNATLNPGLYVITGGANWYNSTITGTGVTLYFTSGGGSGDSKFIISGGCNITISAPTASSSTSGVIAGILVFADRNWTPTNPQDFDIIGSTFTGDGIWYLPKAGLYIYNSGIVTGTNYFGIVADNMTISGTSVRPLNNYSYVATGNPFRTQAPLVQ